MSFSDCISNDKVRYANRWRKVISESQKWLADLLDNWTIQVSPHPPMPDFKDADIFEIWLLANRPSEIIEPMYRVLCLCRGDGRLSINIRISCNSLRYAMMQQKGLV
jgi:hypothetical protein